MFEADQRGAGSGAGQLEEGSAQRVMAMSGHGWPQPHEWPPWRGAGGTRARSVCRSRLNG
eukprot:2909547-Heterocapsa_arctica.AAC.1